MRACRGIHNPGYGRCLLAQVLLMKSLGSRFRRRRIALVRRDEAGRTSPFLAPSSTSFPPYLLALMVQEPCWSMSPTT